MVTINNTYRSFSLGKPVIFSDFLFLQFVLVLQYTYQYNLITE